MLKTIIGIVDSLNEISAFSYLLCLRFSLATMKYYLTPTISVKLHDALKVAIKKQAFGVLLYEFLSKNSIDSIFLNCHVNLLARLLKDTKR